MSFFKKLVKNINAQAALKDQSVSVERMPTESRGGLSSLFGGMTKRRPIKTPTPPTLVAPPSTGIEALIRPQRTDPNNQRDMQRLMDMQKQTFRSFLAPPPPQPATSFGPIDGTSLGLPMGEGTPAPAGVVMEPGGPMFEGETNIDPDVIQDIIDNLPQGVSIPGIGSIPIPDIPYQIPQITEDTRILQVGTGYPLRGSVPLRSKEELMAGLALDPAYQEMGIGTLPQVAMMPSIPQIPTIPSVPQIPMIPSVPQVTMMPSMNTTTMPAMRMARATPSMDYMRER
tara:strand:+ start:830 stop:1684 length:855 start_codon:yes stop_codon:yes gene_type:complete